MIYLPTIYTDSLWSDMLLALVRDIRKLEAVK